MGKVAQLERDHHVRRIAIPRPDEQSNEIEISGAKENCENAKQAIIKLVENKRQSMTVQVISFFKVYLVGSLRFMIILPMENSCSITN